MLIFLLAMSVSTGCDFRVMGCLQFTQSLRKIGLKGKWNTTFEIALLENFREQRWKGTQGCHIFPDGMFQRELNSCSISLPKPSLIPVSGFRSSFLVNGTDSYNMVNAIPGWNLPVVNCSHHLPKSWTDCWFAHVNGKPWFCTMRRVKSHTYDLRSTEKTADSQL